MADPEEFLSFFSSRAMASLPFQEMVESPEAFPERPFRGMYVRSFGEESRWEGPSSLSAPRNMHCVRVCGEGVGLPMVETPLAKHVDDEPVLQGPQRRPRLPARRGLQRQDVQGIQGLPRTV